MCLVELPMGANELDLSLYPIPSPASLNPNLSLQHEIPYTTQTKGGKTVVVANVNDCDQYGFRMCLNLADKHWAVSRYRQCVVLGQRMLAVVEPHLLAGRIISRCLELCNRGADLSQDDGYRFFDEQVTKFAVFRTQARLIVGRGTRELKNYSAAEKILELVYAQQPLDHHSIALAESTLGRDLIANGAVACWNVDKCGGFRKLVPRFFVRNHNEL